jgi:hypothetical protein
MMVPDRTIVRGITVKNLKPSQLPERTVIGKDGPHYEELYIKRADGIWEDLFSGCGHCEDHERISDAGCIKDEQYYSRGGMTTTKTSDEYFVDYKVIAVDPSFCFYIGDLHGEWDHEKQAYPDGAGYHGCKGYNCEG